ncbi:transposase [Methylocystis echinoides]|uniref:Uncharacterized protein n=1 Tax=Methylocystis echinoides TaxID=29468 RepID=A0A9W6GSS2_9HYPH|nr:transposase [Methylocystis echinoides]GLI92230.1 hypothetical protein LMG27198_12220 [Methylocystis echinoides]
MLTAILLAHPAQAAPLRRDAIARSLGSLVDSCVQGLVADAVLVGAPQGGLGAIADEAGCALVESPTAAEGLAAALAMARRDHVFLLAAGAAVERGFVDEINDAFTYGAGDRALVLRLAPHSLLTRMAPGLSQAVGIVATKAGVRAEGTADLGRLAKRLRCGEMSCRGRRTY